MAMQAAGGERRAEPRFKLLVAAKYEDARGTLHRCVTEDASVSGYGIRGTNRPRVGSEMDMELQYVGGMRVKVVRHTERGFGVQILSTAMDRKAFGATMLWLVKSQMGTVTDGRRHERIVPREKDVMLTLPDGRRIPAELHDVSRSGAAVATGVRPAVGQEVRVGRTWGRVVRQLPNGLAIEFLTPLSPSRDLRGDPDL